MATATLGLRFRHPQPGDHALDPGQHRRDGRCHRHRWSLSRLHRGHGDNWLIDVLAALGTDLEDCEPEHDR